MQLKIPRDIKASLRIPEKEIEKELRKELGISLYQRGALSFGKARELAKMNKLEFQKILGKRRIPRHYTKEELREDVRYAGKK